MNRIKTSTMAGFVTALIMMLPAAPGWSQISDLDQLQLSSRLFEVIPGPDGSGTRFVYGDAGTRLHVYKLTRKGIRLDWDSPPFGSRIVRFFYTDVEANGNYELVVFTSAGRILFYDQESYDLVWENVSDNFEEIESAVIWNVDNDPQMELIFIADGRMLFYDGVTRTQEWFVSQERHATELLVANVDADDQLEVILNTGSIVDTKFLEVEWQWNKPFGARISLFDLNEDGFPEVIGELPTFELRVFDVYARREIW